MKSVNKAKLLIIDDEVEFASTLCQRLWLRDIDAVDVHSGGQALAILPDVRPDIVILDLKMADMSGLDVLEKIKEYDANVEVIMLTGHGSVSSGMEAMEKGAFDYIIKPVDLKILLEKINEAIEKRNKE